MDSNSKTGTGELSVSQAWALVRSVPVGRLAVVVDGEPDIFPLNHLVDHGTVVMRTAPGTKLTAALGHRVAFEVDGYDSEAGSAWSVVIKGIATSVTQLHDVVHDVQLPLFPWQAGAKPNVIRIEPTSVTGRQFQVAAGARTPSG